MSVYHVLTVEDANKYLEQQGYRIVIDKMSETISSNGYTKLYYIHVIDQGENTTNNFRKFHPSAQEYNNVLHWAIGSDQALPHYT